MIKGLRKEVVLQKEKRSSLAGSIDFQVSFSQANGQNKALNSQNVEFGGSLKSQERQIMNLTRVTTNFYVKEHRDITLHKVRKK